MVLVDGRNQRKVVKALKRKAGPEDLPLNIPAFFWVSVLEYRQEREALCWTPGTHVPTRPSWDLNFSFVSYPSLFSSVSVHPLTG